MNKLLIAITLATLFLTSCNITKIGVGNASPTQPTVEVGSQRNHFFLEGLIRGGKHNLKAEDFVGDRKDYVVKTKRTFVNGLVSALTFGIYTPTTTSFHIPIDEFKDNSILSSNQDENLIIEETIKEPKKQKRRFLKTSKETKQIEEDIVVKNNDSKTSRKRPKPRNDFDYLEKKSIKKPVIEEDVIINEEEIIVERPLQQQKETTYSRIENTKSINTSKQAPEITKPKSTTSSNGYKAVIYFKNGAKMNGVITENPSGDLTIVLPGGSILKSNMSEISKIDPR